MSSSTNATAPITQASAPWAEAATLTISRGCSNACSRTVSSITGNKIGVYCHVSDLAGIAAAAAKESALDNDTASQANPST
jgi:hypothetical protein